MGEAGLYYLSFVLLLPTIVLGAVISYGFLHSVYLDSRKHAPKARSTPIPHKHWEPDKISKRKIDAFLAKLKASRAERDSNGEAVYADYAQWSPRTYTGSLRAHRVAPKRKLPKSLKIPRPDYADHRTGYPGSEVVANTSFRPAIPVLTRAEQASLRRAGKIGREVLDLAGLAVQPGVRCEEIDSVVHEAAMNRNAYPSPLNYYLFPKSVCTSVNEVICHGVPDAYVLQAGDIVNIDVTVYFEGFHADLNETYFVGGKEAVDSDTVRLVQTAYECLFEAIKAVKPGELYRSLGSKIQPWAEHNGCNVCRTYTGHGVGRLFHCAPTVPHYSGNKTVGVMKPGHAFTVEPMLNLGTWRDTKWPDRWTAVTADGSRSAQFEHTLLVTKDGVEIVTARQPNSRCDVVTTYNGKAV